MRDVPGGDPRGAGERGGRGGPGGRLRVCGRAADANDVVCVDGRFPECVLPAERSHAAVAHSAVDVRPEVEPALDGEGALVGDGNDASTRIDRPEEERE